MHNCAHKNAQKNIKSIHSDLKMSVYVVFGDKVHHMVLVILAQIHQTARSSGEVNASHRHRR